MRTVPEEEEPSGSFPYQLPIAPDKSSAVPLLRLAGTYEKWVFGAATQLLEPPDRRKTGNTARALLGRSLPLTLAEPTWTDSMSEHSASPHK